MPEVDLLCRDVIDDDASSGSQERAEGNVVVVGGDLEKTCLALLLELGIEHTIVLLLGLERVGL